MRSELLGRLSEPTLKKIKVASRQDVPIIMEEVCKAHRELVSDYDKIAAKFWAGSVQKTLEKIFRFCKTEMTYKAESDKSQTVRTPAAILRTANTWGVDCKHYASFIGGVLDALKRMGHPINWCYRFVSYSELDPTPEHVFIVVNQDGKNIFVDPVLSKLNERYPKYYYFTDKFPAMLYRVNGVPKKKIGLIPLDYTNDFVPGSIRTILPVNTPAAQQTAQTETVVKKSVPVWVWLAVGVGVVYFMRKKKR